MSIQTLINLLRDAEVNARKAHGQANYINQYGSNEESGEWLVNYAQWALVGINQALREAEQIKAESEKKEESK